MHRIKFERTINTITDAKCSIKILAICPSITARCINKRRMVKMFNHGNTPVITQKEVPFVSLKIQARKKRKPIWFSNSERHWSTSLIAIYFESELFYLRHVPVILLKPTLNCVLWILCYNGWPWSMSRPIIRTPNLTRISYHSFCDFPFIQRQ